MKVYMIRNKERNGFTQGNRIFKRKSDLTQHLQSCIKWYMGGNMEIVEFELVEKASKSMLAYVQETPCLLDRAR